MASTHNRVVAIRTPSSGSHLRTFGSMDAAMKKYVTRQSVTALVRITVLCGLAVASVSFSPGFAATLSRSADVGSTLSAMWSMIGPLCAIKDWLPPPGAGARGSADQTTSLS
jgi:hypothetical protein